MASPIKIPTCEHYHRGVSCPAKAHRYDEPTRTYLCYVHYMEAVKSRETWQRRD